MTDNVVSFEKPKGKKPKTEAEEDKEWYLAQVSAFNALYGKYLRARGGAIKGNNTDAALDKALDAINEATWELIRARAMMPYHIEYKFEVMREIMGGGWADGRDRFMLESLLLDHKELMMHR